MFASASAHESGVARLPVLVDAQPIGRVMEVEIALALLLRPVFQAFRERRSRRRKPRRLRAGAEPAGQDRLGLVVERAEKLSLPAVPDARADGADIADGKHQEQPQPLHRLHDVGEVEDGSAVGEVARLRDPRHGQMLLDEPGDELRLVGREPEARAEPPRHLGAGDRMVLRPALGDVVQEERDRQHGQIFQRRKDLARKRMILDEAPGADCAKNADGADQVLVHRIVVVHVELHHRDDLAEVGDEAAEHAGLVHVAKHRVGVFRVAEDFEEEPVRLRIVLHLPVDALQRLGDEPQRVRMEGELAPPRLVEDADQVDRIALENVVAHDVDPPMVGEEVG